MVIYQSLWGNTAAVARAIAQGIGPGTTVVHTGELSPEEAAEATLLVVGAPVHAMTLPSASTLASVALRPLGPGDVAADLDQPLMRDWVSRLPDGDQVAAAFDTRVAGALGRGGTSTLERLLKARGCRLLHPGEGFVVVNMRAVRESAGMLREGELARATAWGKQLAALV